MTPTLQADPLPLRVEADGGIRVGDTRVHLEIVIGEHKKGRTPDDIVRSFDTLKLADVYAVIAYYLQHTDEVDRYIAERDQQAEEWRRKMEAEGMSRPSFLEELRARRDRMEKNGAPSSDR